LDSGSIPVFGNNVHRVVDTSLKVITGKEFSPGVVVSFHGTERSPMGPNMENMVDMVRWYI
jgi:hypothetical protein